MLLWPLCGNQEVPSAIPIPPELLMVPLGTSQENSSCGSSGAGSAAFARRKSRSPFSSPFFSICPQQQFQPAWAFHREKSGIPPLAPVLHPPQAPCSCHMDECLSGHICESPDSCCPQLLQEMDVPSLPPPLLTLKTLKSNQFFFLIPVGFFLPFSPCSSSKMEEGLSEGDNVGVKHSQE